MSQGLVMFIGNIIGEEYCLVPLLKITFLK